MLAEKTHSVVVKRENKNQCSLYRDCPFSFACDVLESLVHSPIVKMHFDKNTHLFRNEIDYGCIYVVISGVAAVYTTLESGEPMVYGLVGRGQTIGETEYFTHRKVIYEVKTITPAVFCRLPTDFLSTVLEREPHFMSRFLQASNACALMFSRQLWVTNAQRIYDRLKRLLYLLAKLQKDNIENENLVNISHEELALLINTDRASVTRTLNKLKKENLINLKYGQIQIIGQLFDFPEENDLDPYILIGWESPILGTR